MKYLLIPLLSFIIYSCNLLEDSEESGTIDIASGLIEALKIGADSATSTLSKTDGYFLDQTVKILLPSDILEQIDNFKLKEINLGLINTTGAIIYESGFESLGINSMQSLEEDLILGINRAAESAATDALPVFLDAITNITIEDAESILFGTDSAATEYLKERTRSFLFDAYEPKMDDAINEVKINGKSADNMYKDFVDSYNTILNTEINVSLFTTNTIGEMVNLDTLVINDLSEYATNEGLDGLFLKVKEEEGKIRTNPLHRVTELLKDVFNKLD